MARTEIPAVAVEPTVTVKCCFRSRPRHTRGREAGGAPEGSPLTDMATGELNPFALATVMVKEVELPTFTLAPIGLAKG